VAHTKLESKHEFRLNATGFLRKKVAKTKFGPDSVPVWDFGVPKWDGMQWEAKKVFFFVDSHMGQ
jgi:hypothetical protein